MRYLLTSSVTLFLAAPAQAASATACQSARAALPIKKWEIISFKNLTLSFRAAILPSKTMRKQRFAYEMPNPIKAYCAQYSKLQDLITQ